MRTRAAAGLFVLLLTGCPGGPQVQPVPDIDLSKARRLESEGKILEAVVEYARLVRDLQDSGRSDTKARAAWARTLEALRRIRFRERLAQAPPEVRKSCDSLVPWNVPAGYAFLSAGAASHWTYVLSAGAEPPLLAEAAGEISRLLAEKLDDPSLRRGRLDPPGPVSERLYRRSLAEAASDYALYALGRTQPRNAECGARAAGLLDRLATEVRALAVQPGVRPGAAAYWEERASEAQKWALAIRSDPARYELSNDLRQVVERDPDGLFRLATDLANAANREMSQRGDEQVILESLEQALRHFIAGRECLVEPSPLQKRTLDILPITADTLRSVGFAK
ncbi:MAG TPA: hypothetical protein VGK61_00485 [Planctomycetota bacterium]|jgi:hypothetical protein